MPTSDEPQPILATLTAPCSERDQLLLTLYEDVAQSENNLADAMARRLGSRAASCVHSARELADQARQHAEQLRAGLS